MKNFKRIVSFMMAMIIFASFFCYNIGAISTRYVLYEYGDTFAREFFSNTSAYAFVSIRNWAEEENTTDLRASTYANIEDYENLYDAVVYVDLTVWLEDGSYSNVDDIGYMDPEEVTVDALVRGTECLNYDDHYSIADFSSTHKVQVFIYQYDSLGDYDEIIVEYDGPIINIRTRD
jgi:hypothetical protein